MKAIIQRSYGSPDLLELRDVPVPALRDHQVRIRVRAAALNAADWILLRGEPYLVRVVSGIRTPKAAIPGKSIAGEVSAVGRAVTRFRPGDAVYGELVSGGFAEYAVAVPDRLSRKPANLTFEQAAAVPLAGPTALQGLRDRGEVKPGHEVLINGAAGGVGTFAVQIAKALGARVTGVCRTRNLDLVRDVGADHVVDCTGEDIVQSSRRYDVVVDLLANRSLADWRRVLRPDGTLVLAGGGGSRWCGSLGLVMRAVTLSPFVRPRLRPLMARPDAQSLAALTDLIEAGRVTPAIDRTYPLGELPQALRYLGEEHARAKVVITV